MDPKNSKPEQADADAEAAFAVATDHHRAKRLDEAEYAYKTILTQYPDHALTIYNLADVFFQAQDFKQAIDLFTKVIAIEPDNGDVHIDLGRVYQEQGRFQDALDCYSRGILLVSHSTRALALMGEALLAAGRRQELNFLVDFDRLIQTQTIEAPADYDSLEDFNAALVAYSVNHPSLASPTDKATIYGRQTGNLNGAEEGSPIHYLIACIQKFAMKYYDRRSVDPGHPFLSQEPGPRSIDIWATVLDREGHQLTHIHRNGWLSGVYYAKVPDVIRRDDPIRTGWIEFGRPRIYPAFISDIPTRHYLPEEGTLFLFPSYFWHRTVPLQSDEVRVSIAFDLISPKQPGNLVELV